MTFPIINYKFNDLKEAQALTEVLELKLSSLEKYLHEDEAVICDVEFDKVAQQQSGQIHKIGINLVVEGTLFRAEATEESFEKAIDKVREELDKELRRAKDKVETLRKQEGLEAKEQMLRVE
ncbi:MAG: hypothetical protein RLZZ230_185 [Candidatus Parcubacteria bacterium]|jgi:ribosomal subunit interface protein